MLKHCLVVDDSAVIRKVARRILESLSFKVSEAEDGRQALAACQGGMPDAVFLDGAMPTMDGYEFLKELRRMPGGDGPKVVFCTAENEVAPIARAMRAGADDFILKPFDPESVASKFQDVGLL
jgi:two-component system, chemotaxis family, chemotaxis protein CheY